MDKELKLQIAKVVEDLFNEKEEAEIRKEIEDKLRESADTINGLTASLEEKNDEVADFEQKVSDAEARITELTSELEAAKTELEEANTKLVETENTLEDMKKDRAAEVRMTELEDAGVTRSDRDSQMAKVREMTDEDFASYKDELVSIRKAVVAELEKAREQAEADAKAEEEVAEEAAEEEAKKMKEDEMEDEEDKKKMKKSKKKEECSEESSEEDSEEASEEDSEEEQASEEETTAPAEITPGQAAMASLNLEYIPNEDVRSKYAELGASMAEAFKKSK
jgi:septal ring factor EnvC (AmiA/AmiB activator)